MTDTIVDSGTNVKFIGALTPMTQANWQEYFSALHKSGVISGFAINGNDSLGNPKLYGGTVIANGIIASYKSESEYVSVPDITTSDVDMLILARVYLKTEKIEIIRKTHVSTGTYTDSSAYAQVLINMLQNEAAYCERTDDHFDIPLWYVGESIGSVDARRFIAVPSDTMGPLSILLKGNCTYRVTGSTTVKYVVNGFCQPERIKIVAEKGATVLFTQDLMNLTSTYAYVESVGHLVNVTVPLTWKWDDSVFEQDTYAFKRTVPVTHEFEVFDVIRTADYTYAVTATWGI